MRYAILSDIHANLPALQAVDRHMEGREISNYFFTGDLIGYGPHPNECVNLMNALIPKKKARYFGVKGNLDVALLEKSWKYISNDHARITLDWTDRVISDTNRDRMKAFSDEGLPIDGADLVHATLEDPTGKLTGLYFDSNDITWEGSFTLLGPGRLGFYGHTHRPRYFTANPAKSGLLGFPIERVDIPYSDPDSDGCSFFELSYHSIIDAGESLFVSMGSIGQPRDYDPRAGYGIWDTEARTITFFRIPYNIVETQNALRNLEGQLVEDDSELESRIIQELCDRLDGKKQKT
jgi:predicted phosphodiesterase